MSSTMKDKLAKKKKSTKKLKKRAASWTDEDVQVSTNLPPLVEGQLRCYLKVCVNQILWMIPNAPELTHARLIWWGEAGKGTIFRPIDVKKGSKSTSRTTARYPIRSGPKQFQAYLNDMGGLVFEVLSGPMSVPVGRAQIDHIASLGPNRPINGFFPVFSADAEKVAELQVSVVLESLMASFDSNSTVPTPDMSADFYSTMTESQPVQPPTATAVPTTAVYSTGDDPFRSPAANRVAGRSTPQGYDPRPSAHPLRESAQSFKSYHTVTSSRPSSGKGPTTSTTTYPFNQGAPTPTPTHHLATGLSYDGSEGTLNGLGTLESQVASKATTPRDPSHHPSTSTYRADPQPPTTHDPLPHMPPLLMNTMSTDSHALAATPTGRHHDNSHSSDLVSVLLERGNKLKQAMIEATVDQTPEHMEGLEGLGGVFSPLKREGSTGDLFKEILKDNRGQPVSVSRSMDFDDVDGRTVELVLGEDPATAQQMKMMKEFDGDFSSGGSSLAEDFPSDEGDPMHDDSILEDLFYKDLSDESELSLDEGGDTPRTPRSNQPPRPARRSHSVASSNASLASLEDEGNKRPPSRGSRRSSLSSLTFDLEPTRDNDPVTSHPSKIPRRKKPKQTSDAEQRGRPRTKKSDGAPTKARKKTSKSRSTSGDRSRSRTRSASGGGKGTERKGRKGTRTKSRSRSRDMAGSDSDGGRLSESSRVSFDPMLSDAEGRKKGSQVDGLSVQRLTLLGRVNVARVVIDRLWLDDSTDTAASQRGGAGVSRGKPPRPASGKGKSTYFVEYNFPVVATSRDKHKPNAMATEVMRVASKNVDDGVVSLQHRSVFPVMFDGDSVEKWWKSALVFKVYARRQAQKVPKLLGMCSLPLKSVLKSEALYMDEMLDVKDRSGASGAVTEARNYTGCYKRKSDWPIVGNLKVNIELASDSKDFANVMAKTRLAEMTNPKIIPIPQPKPTLPPPLKQSTGKDFEEIRGGNTVGLQTEPQKTNIHDLPLVPPPDPRPSYAPPHSSHNVHMQQDILPMESLTLHSLLLIPDGINITVTGQKHTRHGDKMPSANPPQPTAGWTVTSRDRATRNLYLVARMFWCDDVSRSGVCWGTCDPEFKFSQEAPMLLTASLLERMRNNVMVVEVWDKKTTAEKDQLVGMCKLSLHQFYMSFRDRKVAAALLKSQYPVVSIDGELPIVNPFSGAAFGKLKVLLAMGSSEQVHSLQRIKLDPRSAISVTERPAHYLERQQVYSEGLSSHQHNTVEHIFEVSLEGVTGLRLLENMIWGEADCFIQYHFPAQQHSKQQGQPQIVHATPSLKTFRSATTLCVPDPSFGEVLRHKIVLPEGTPVQREVLTACAGAGGGAGGVPFEVWCRYYYPNVRDQVIAKTVLPLAKLCAMVTMQKRGEPSVQSFPLRLSSISPVSGSQEEEEEEGGQHTAGAETGVLNVTINYRANVIKATDLSGPPASLSRMVAPGATTCISVGVVRASGLKTAAKLLSRHDSGMQYCAEVGVNSYVRVKLSFLQSQDERITRTVARTFSPDFSFYMDFPCPLLWSDPDADALSLAEILETATATFEVWHQVPTPSIDTGKHYEYTGSGEVKGRRLVSMSGGDLLLGTASIPLLSLLTRKTGVSGWHPLLRPPIGWGDQQQQTTTNDEDHYGDEERKEEEQDIHGDRGLQRVVGGLEVAVKFAHQEDLERVVHAGRGVGWAPDYDVEHRDWDSADETLDRLNQVAVNVDIVTFPVHNALIAGQTALTNKARCYIRYKLYDKGARCSPLCELEEKNDTYVTAQLAYSKDTVIQSSAPFSWYLREERLEVQVWVTHQAQKDGGGPRPRNRDKLIGAAYIDLSSLADAHRKQHRVSGVYPLFKPGACSLDGACLRAHVSIKPHVGGYTDDEEEQSDDGEYPGKSRQKPRSPAKRSPHKKTGGIAVDPTTTFPVHVSIERAFHLPLITDNGLSHLPSCYVSYQTADCTEVTCTDVFPNSENPIWHYEHDTHMHRELLTDANKHVVFKAWHHPGDPSTPPDKATDRVLGFVSVDLTPLTAGFRVICGWYNIMDFHGQCQGQIKVSITPQESVTGMENLASTTPAGEQGTGQSYVATATYGSFPAHLAWYPEQHIALTSGTTSGDLPHFSEHFDNVKKHHEQLNQRMIEMGVSDPGKASRSILFNNLRTNMSELDDITLRLKQRLGASPAPPPHQPTVASHETHVVPEQFTQDQGQPHQSEGQQGDGQDEREVSVYTQSLMNAQQLLQNLQFANNNLPQFPTTSESTYDPNKYPYGADTEPKTTTLDYTEETDVGKGAKRPHVQFDNGYRGSESLQSSHYQEDDNEEKYTEARDLNQFDEDDTYEQEWQKLDDEHSEEDVEGEEMVMVRPLNDVSSANFDNYRPRNEAGARDLMQVEEQDSWMTNPQDVSRHEDIMYAGTTGETDVNDLRDTQRSGMTGGDTDLGGTQPSDSRTHDTEFGDPPFESGGSRTLGTSEFGTSAAMRILEANFGGSDGEIGDGSDRMTMRTLEETDYGGTNRINDGTRTLDSEFSRTQGLGTGSEYFSQTYESKKDGIDVNQRIDFESTNRERQNESPVYADEENEEDEEAEDQVDGNESKPESIGSEERLLLSQEDPFHQRQVSRSLTDSRSSGLSSRKAAMYRREYLRHRNASISSESSSEDEENKERPAQRQHRRRKKDADSGKRKQEDEDWVEFKEDAADEGTQGNEGKEQQEEAAAEEDDDDGDKSTSSYHSSKHGDPEYMEHEVIVLDSKEHMNTEPVAGTSKKSEGGVPNFFLPPRDLEQTMKKLKPPQDLDRQHHKAAVAHELTSRIAGSSSLTPGGATVSVKNRAPPDATQTQRIAKIFAQKYSKS